MWLLTVILILLRLSPPFLCLLPTAFALKIFKPSSLSNEFHQPYPDSEQKCSFWSHCLKWFPSWWLTLYKEFSVNISLLLHVFSSSVRGLLSIHCHIRERMLHRNPEFFSLFLRKSFLYLEPYLTFGTHLALNQCLFGLGVMYSML